MFTRIREFHTSKVWARCHITNLVGYQEEVPDAAGERDRVTGKVKLRKVRDEATGRVVTPLFAVRGEPVFGRLPASMW